MASTSAICTSFKADLLAGTHTAADTYKIALYTTAATNGAGTTAYSATNEVTGTGYTAGGATLTGFAVGQSGTTVWLDFTTDPSWANSTLSTVASCLIYNSSKSNKALAVFDFGGVLASTAGTTLTLTFPAADATNALIRIA